jgi:hypothetical protein
VEALFQSILDILAEISEDVVRTQDVRLIIDVLGLIKEIATDLVMVADSMGLDVDPRTPVD